MYGVRSDLDLTAFVNAEVIQVCFGVYDIQLRFISDDESEPSAFISGAFEMDGYCGCGEKRCSGDEILFNLLGKTVRDAKPLPPDRVVLTFDSGIQLRLIDSSQQFESFILEPGNIIM